LRFLGYHGGGYQDHGVLWCDALKSDKRAPTFRKQKKKPIASILGAEKFYPEDGNNRFFLPK
jgi:hypothetical protein